MWKFVLVLLVTALSLLAAQLIADAPDHSDPGRRVVGIEAPATPGLAYAGVRG